MRIDGVRAAVLVAGVALAVGQGCASEPKPRPATIDPSNPAAAESTPLQVTPMSGGGPALSGPVTTLPAADTAPDAGPAGGQPHEHSAGAPPAAQPTYTCPMHPEVVSDKPGSCPKCGMKLMPKEPAGGRK